MAMDTEALKRRIAQEINEQFESRLREARREKTEVEEELESSSERWRAERRRLNSEIDRLEAALTDAKATVKKPSGEQKENEDQTAELTAMLAGAEERLTAASSEWAAERARFEEEIERLRASVTEILERSNNPVRSLHTIQQKLESQLQDAQAANERLENEFSRAKAAWEEERARIAGELFRTRRGGSSELSEDSDSLRKARAEIKDLQRQLAEAKETAKKQKSGKPRENPEKLQELTQKNIELDRERTQERQRAAALAEELRRVSTEMEAARQRASSLEEELQQSRLENEQLERRLVESRDSVSGDVVEQLRAQYAARIEEIVQEKTQLAGRLESASVLLEQERQRFTMAAASTQSLDQQALEAEISRVENAIEEITRFIDDPGAQLAAVIRKNVERAELDAYLKGIMFARGQTGR